MGTPSPKPPDWDADERAVVVVKPESHVAPASPEVAPTLAALAAGLAHEVNNPLAYVLTNLDFAREQLSAECNADVLAALEEARLGALRIGAIVRALQLVASGAAQPDADLDIELGEIREPACALATKPRPSR